MIFLDDSYIFRSGVTNRPTVQKLTYYFGQYLPLYEPLSSRLTPTEPSPPRNLRVDVVTATEARLSWLAPENPNGYLRGYDLLKTVGEHENEWREVVDYVGQRMNYTMKRLRPGTYYRVRIVAENGAGESNASNPVEFETLEEPPGPVGDLKQKLLDLTEVTLTWTKPKQPNGRSLSYFLVYKEHPEPGEKGYGQEFEEMVTKEILGRSNVSFQYTLKGLKFDTRYRIKVIAKNKQGPGNASESIKIKTLKPGKRESVCDNFS
ncbi:neogenin 1 [Elysia marginata]|uniref:Neogenin 1 n=1 Tax=Elysia marginata TaxID=1093978 RepID=A0AAV4GAU0_9GAST|nr:neogenin 1 [Elysia marginata]